MSNNNNDKGLLVDNISAGIGEKLIVRDVRIMIRPGEIHALMGPNGSGKSTVAYALMGHPLYKIYSGRIYLDGEDITDLPPEERYRKGLFLAFQIPPETMVKTRTLYLQLARVRKIPFSRVIKLMRDLDLKEEVLDRYLNKGFSGGEMKRSEIVQMYLSEPRYAILDEPDSGVDVEGLNAMSRILGDLREKKVGVLVITHTGRIFRGVDPDAVHVLIGGRIIASGDKDLIRLIDEKGYEYFRKRVEETEIR
ncbi:MAG: Fe-S cluster assembly ATPase SufC [Sulfolobales archaeon]